MAREPWSRPYRENASAAFNPAVHLTNAAVSRRSVAQDVAKSTTDVTWSLQELWSYGNTQGWNTSKMKVGIYDIIAKSVLSNQMENDTAWGHMQYPRRIVGTCFELLGVDIIFRADGTPALMEINNGPELISSGVKNQAVHNVVLSDLYNMLLTTGFRQIPTPEPRIFRNAHPALIPHLRLFHDELVHRGGFNFVWSSGTVRKHIEYICR